MLKDINDMADKIVQTEVIKTCHFEMDSEQGKVLIKEDKIICVMKRAKCSDEEWKDYEEKVQSEMEISELLEDLGKVLEAASRLAKKGTQPNVVKNTVGVEAESEFHPDEKDECKSQRNESVEKESEEGWIYCEICSYKCKKKKIP